MEKEYKIDFVEDYSEYEEWSKDEKFRDRDYWKRKIDKRPEQLAMCQKWKGKTIKLSELPDFIEEVGDVILDGERCLVYNGYVE